MTGAAAAHAPDSSPLVLRPSDGVPRPSPPVRLLSSSLPPSLLTHVPSLAAPVGTLYWTVEEGIWSPATASVEGQERLLQKEQQLRLFRLQALDAVHPYVSPYLSPAAKWLEMPDLRGYWNCGVKWTFRKVVDFDAGAQGRRAWRLVSDRVGAAVGEAGEGKPKEAGQ